MTARERFLAAARREPPDVVPAAPYAGNFGSAVSGVPISEYNTDASKMAAAQIRSWELVGHDVVVAQSDNYYIAEGYGCVIEQPFDSTPHLVTPAVKELDDIEELRVPDPYHDGRMPVYLDAVHALRTHFGNEVAVRGPGTGPFSLASYLAGGTQRFLMDIGQAEADEDVGSQDRIRQLIDIATEGLIAFLKALLEAGSDVAQCGDSLASPDMISPAVYEKYVFPFESRLFETVSPIAHRKGAVTVLHICGDTRKILPLMARTGADVLEIDAAVPMSVAQELTDGRTAVMGNLDPTSVLLEGTPELVERSAVECLRSTNALAGGVILGSGCEVAPRTPIENLRALVRTAHSFRG